MIDRVENLPRPDPDFNRLLAVLRRQHLDHIPILELKLDEEVRNTLVGETMTTWWDGPWQQRRHSIVQTIRLMHRLGYDAFRIPINKFFKFNMDTTNDTAKLSRGKREWQSENSGPIQTFQDLEQFRWPTLTDVDFRPAELIASELPDGMACLGFCNGIFEWSSWLMGLEPLAVALYEQPALVREIVDRTGQLIYNIFEVWAQTDHIIALWSGDDMGFKTGTLVGPKHLREYFLPWHHRYAELAHAYGKPYLLHSCGNLSVIMTDLVENIGIDAKHSFEDVIQPVEEFVCQWHDKVAAIGGVDVDTLARGSEEQVIQRTQQILEVCAPKGSYAAGSGNTVANYIPIGNYLAMVETVHRFNGRL